MAKRRGRRQIPRPTGPEVTSAPQPPYTIRLTESAEAVYRSIHDLVQAANGRGETSTAHHTLLRMLDEVLDNIPKDPLNKKFALTGTLTNMFRMKKGRTRVCWIASSERREVIVLFISDTPRKEGDAHDPYKIFAGLVMSGQFDGLFDRLGVKRPNRKLSNIKISANALLQPASQLTSVWRH